MSSFLLTRVASRLPRVSLTRSLSTAVSYAESLHALPDTKVTTLDNGLTIATESNASMQTATVGMWIDAGSRFESAKNNGTAHFLEHMAFKGTKSRTQGDLEVLIENMGGHLNAYTSREQTVYYAKCLAADVPTSVDILADILQNSTLSADAIERERDVILREMEEVEKQKEEVVFDHLHAAAFQGNALGLTILGPEENIRSISRDDLETYIDRNYTPDRMVLAAAGNVDHDALVKKAEKAFGAMKPGAGKKILHPAKFVGSDVRIRYDEHPTSHIALAVEGASWTNPDYWPLLVAQSLIGSWDRSLGAAQNVSSKLAQNMQKYNLANSFMSFNTSYSDTGLFGVYVVTEARENLDDVVHNVQKEWHHLALDVSAGEVARAKNQLKSSLLLALDGTTPVAEDIGRQILCYGKRYSPFEIDQMIERVTVQDVKSVANKYIYDRDVCVVGYGPVESLQDYNRIRSAMSPAYF